MADARTDGPAESTGDLIRRVIDNLSTLIDKQVELARQEATEEARTAAAGGGMMGAGAVALFVSLLFLLTALCFAVDRVWFPGYGWLAALVIALLFAGLGATLLLVGRGRLRLRPLGRTRDSLREDVEWARRQLRPTPR